jgi:hypothetical protein
MRRRGNCLRFQIWESDIQACSYIGLFIEQLNAFPNRFMEDASRSDHTGCFNIEMWTCILFRELTWKCQTRYVLICIRKLFLFELLLSNSVRFVESRGVMKHRPTYYMVMNVASRCGWLSWKGECVYGILGGTEQFRVNSLPPPWMEQWSSIANPWHCIVCWLKLLIWKGWNMEAQEQVLN